MKNTTTTIIKQKKDKDKITMLKAYDYSTAKLMDNSGAGCDGQVLVYQDMLGMFSDFTPKFAKRFVDVGNIMTKPFKQYIAEIKAVTFPSDEHTFDIADEIIDKLY